MIKFTQIHIGEANFHHYFIHSSFISPEIFSGCSLYVSIVLHPVSGGETNTQFPYATYVNQSSSVQFSRSVMSNSLWPHESQHTRPPCPLPSPGAYSNSCPLNRWCRPAISSTVIPFSSCSVFFSIRVFQMSQLFPWGGQSTGVSASASILPMNTQD